MVHSPAGFLFCLYNCVESKASKGADIGIEMIVLINKNSGGGTAQRKWNLVYPQLNLNGSTETFVVGTNGSADEFIVEALKKGKTDFIIAGGDGSINYFLNRCIQLLEPSALKQIKIGAVGIGSSNDFHKPFHPTNMIENVPYKINFKNAVLRDVGCLLYEKDGKDIKKIFSD